MQAAVLEQGGIIDVNDGFGARHHTGLTIVLFMLQQKFMPFGYEQNIAVAQEMMSFNRHGSESIDAALCRYDIIRFRAQQEANLDFGPAGTANHLLKALHIPPSQWPMMLQSFGGNLPRNEAELIALQEMLRRYGHLSEGHLQHQGKAAYATYNWTPGGPPPTTRHSNGRWV